MRWARPRWRPRSHDRRKIVDESPHVVDLTSRPAIQVGVNEIEATLGHPSKKGDRRLGLFTFRAHLADLVEIALRQPVEIVRIENPAELGVQPRHRVDRTASARPSLRDRDPTQLMPVASSCLSPVRCDRDEGQVGRAIPGCRIRLERRIVQLLDDRRRRVLRQEDGVPRIGDQIRRALFGRRVTDWDREQAMDMLSEFNLAEHAGKKA